MAEKNRKKGKRANITVEASFIIPIVLSVIFALLYLTFYLHDRVRAEVIVERALGKGNFLIAQRSDTDGSFYGYENNGQRAKEGYFKASYEEQEAVLLEYLEKELEKGFCLLHTKQLTCETEGFSLKVKVKLEGKFSWNPIKNFCGEMPEFVIERSVPLHSPEEMRRLYEGLELVMDRMEAFCFARNYISQNKSILEGVN